MQAVKAMVQQAAQYVDDAPDMDTRNELIETLNSVSFGKVPTKFLSCLFLFEAFILYPRMPMQLGIIIVSLKLVFSDEAIPVKLVVSRDQACYNRFWNL